MEGKRKFSKSDLKKIPKSDFKKISTWFVVPDEKKNSKSASYSDMLRYAKSFDYFLLLIGLVSSFVNGAMLPINSIAFQGMVNVLITGQGEYENGTLDKEKLAAGMTFYSWLYFAIGILIFVLTFFGMSALYTLCERQVHLMRKYVFKSILNQDMEWFDRNEVGTLTHKMVSNIEKIKDGASDKPGIVLQGLGSLVAGISIGLYLNWKLALVMVIIVPFVIFSIYGSAKALSAAIYHEITAYSAAGGIAEEVLLGIRTVTAFNSQNFEINRYRYQLKKGKTVGIRKAAMTGFFSGLLIFIMFIAMGVCFYIGTNMVLNEKVDPGTVFSVFWAVLMGAMHMGQAIPQISVIVGAKIAAKEIFEIIDRKPKLDCSNPTGRTISDLKGKLEFMNLHFRYPTRPGVKIINNISFEVKPGQNVALVGHSGSGKSTVIGLLMRYYQQESGSITIDGIPLEDLNVEWLRSTIGIVSQEPVIFQATVAENLRLGKSDVTKEEIEEACRMANAHEFIVKLQHGYDTRIGQGGIQLSGGQKQRLAIARALIRQPKILLLDEATSALDTESERLVQAALDKASSGRTTITIAHRLSTVRNADKIIVFDHGQIIESGTHNELFAKEDGFYRQLVLAQQIAGRKEPIYETEVDDQPEFLKNQASERLRRSIASVRETSDAGIYLDDVQDELEAEGTGRASMLDILKFAKPELKLAVSGFVLSLTRGLTWPFFSLIYGRFFLSLSGDDHSAASETAIMNGVSFAAIGVFGGIATFASGFLLGTTGEKVAMRLRLSVYKNILRQDSSYFDTPSHSVGILTSRLSQDASNVQAAIDQRLAEVLQGLTALVFGIIIAFYFGWNMAPFCIVLAVILVILQTVISSYLKRRGTDDAEVAGDASKIVTESIENVKTIQALTRQKEILEDFRLASILPHRRSIARGLFQSLSYAISTSYSSFNFFASYMFGLWLCLNDFSSPFIVFQVIEALNMAAMIISTSASYFPEYIKARISAGLMFRMMRENPKIDNLSQSGVLAPIEGNIQLQHVRFAYPNGMKYMTLNGLNLEAKYGQTVAIVGASGCGKSTVIQLIERFYDILGGTLRIDGQDIRQINVRHLRSSIALVGQEPTLFNLSIRENIGYGLESVPMEKIKAAAKLANIDEFIESLPDKYETSVGGRGSQLSGGQRQRIAIARAILREPKILLLDEATAALDGESEKLVQEALDRARDGRTCLVVAHRLSTIQNADLIYVLENGKVLESGDHQQLLERKGLYYRLVKSQSMN